jgi:tetrahydromethanopterin S-methyltransferase subunit A
MTTGDTTERPGAVELMRRLDALRDLATGRTLRQAAGRWRGRPSWPVTAGSYVVADPAAPIAVCTLTDDDLMRAAADLPGVAIAGRVHTANLGLEKIILNVTTNPRIRFLLVCGKDSPLFHPGQTLAALAAAGIDADHRVIGARGYLPVLRGVPASSGSASRSSSSTASARPTRPCWSGTPPPYSNATPAP